MAKESNIQWCDDTINAVMGCDGCELFATPFQIEKSALDFLSALNPPHKRHAVNEANRLIKGTNLLATDIYHARENISTRILVAGGLVGKELKRETKALMKVIASGTRCYAAILHLRHGNDDNKPGKWTNKGYAPKFESPTLFPGRTASLARSADLKGTSRSEKPWLGKLPRIVFFSDMGDALSKDVPFDFLKTELIDVAMSPNGQRHIWLWLTKRPARMAQFSDWLTKQGIPWPDNVVAMTSVTSHKTLSRVDELRKVGARFRGLSIEPLWENVASDIDLTGIDWAIIGGESGGSAKPFDLQWARDLRDRCKADGVAYFVKQLGQNPTDGGKPVTLKHLHGGDWDEWDTVGKGLKVRQFPAGFSGLGSLVPSQPGKKAAGAKKAVAAKKKKKP